MYRVCFQDAALEQQCDTLEQALEGVRAAVGEFDVLPGADERFWLCCQNINDSDSEVVARIYLDVDDEQANPPVDTAVGGRGLGAPSADGLERAPESAERLTPASAGRVVQARRTPTGS